MDNCNELASRFVWLSSVRLFVFACCWDEIGSCKTAEAIGGVGNFIIERLVSQQ